MSRTRTAALDLISFINASPSPYHAVLESVNRLERAGFTRVSEKEPHWTVTPGGKYYVTRGQSAFVAFAIGEDFAPGNGLTMSAAHSDSPCLRVKPKSTLEKGGYLSLGVETYGGGLWYTWFDRDLSIAGRVIVARGDGSFESRLVKVDRPILRIPSLAIHLDRGVNDSFKVNTESQLPPVLATAIRAKLEETSPALAVSVKGTGGALTRHHTGLVRLLATELGCEPEAVHDFDLCLFDTQGSALGGLWEEFIFSPRLDNLCMTHSTLTGLISSCSGESSLAGESNVRVVASFNHEEVGSSSVPGAGGTLLDELVDRLCLGAPELRAATLRKSFLVSADMAHALHPNHSGLHEENHRPAMHSGLVIKANGNQRYATEVTTAFLTRRVAEVAKCPIQDFCVRQDMGCGSTVGPILATRLGCRTVDVGLPQLSMHSCREMCGVSSSVVPSFPPLQLLVSFLLVLV